MKDARKAKEIILSQDFRTYSMADRYRQLESRTNYDFSAVIRLLEHLPVFIDGESHQIIRKAMARQISRTQKCQFSLSEEILEQLLRTLLHPDRDMDLVVGFAQPLWRAISSSIVPRSELVLSLVDEIPGLFSPLLSIRKRKDICTKIEDFLNLHNNDQEDELILLCLASLGTRPFAGTLSLSLYEIFLRNPEKRFCDIQWPAIFPSSSLRYVDRICLRQTRISDLVFDVGERVRCFTQSEGYTLEENTSSLFGFGLHTCLGKSISERVWKLIIEKFSKIEIRATCKNIIMSPHNDPFMMAAHAYVRLS